MQARAIWFLVILLLTCSTNSNAQLAQGLHNKAQWTIGDEAKRLPLGGQRTFTGNQQGVWVWVPTSFGGKLHISVDGGTPIKNLGRVKDLPTGPRKPYNDGDDIMGDQYGKYEFDVDASGTWTVRCSFIQEGGRPDIVPWRHWFWTKLPVSRTEVQVPPGTPPVGSLFKVLAEDHGMMLLPLHNGPCPTLAGEPNVAPLAKFDKQFLQLPYGSMNGAWGYEYCAQKVMLMPDATRNTLVKLLKKPSLTVAEKNDLKAAMHWVNSAWAIGHCPLGATASWLFEQPTTQTSNPGAFDFSEDDLEGLCTLLLRGNYKAMMFPLRKITSSVKPVGSFHRKVLEESLRRLGRGVIARRANDGDWNDVCYSYSSTMSESSVEILDPKAIPRWRVIDVTTDIKLANYKAPLSPGTCEAPNKVFDIRRMKYRIVFDDLGNPLKSGDDQFLSVWISIKACDSPSTTFTSCEPLNDFLLIGPEAEACFPETGDAHGDNKEVTAARLRSLGIKKRAMPTPLWGEPLK